MSLVDSSLEDHVSPTIMPSVPRPPDSKGAEQLHGLADYQHSSLPTADDSLVELRTYTWALPNCLSKESFRSSPFELCGAKFTLGFWPRGGMVHLPLALPAGEECASFSLRYEGDADALKCHVALRLLRPPPPPLSGRASPGAAGAGQGVLAQEAVADVVLGHNAVADLEIQRSVGWERFVRLSDLTGGGSDGGSSSSSNGANGKDAESINNSANGTSSPKSSGLESPRGCLGPNDTVYLQVGVACYERTLEEVKTGLTLAKGGSIASLEGDRSLQELEQQVNQEFADADERARRKPEDEERAWVAASGALTYPNTALVRGRLPVAPSTAALVRYYAQQAAAQRAAQAAKRQASVLSVSRPLGHVPCTRATTVPALPASLKQARQQQADAALVLGVSARSLLLASVASPSGPRAATTQRPPRARVSRATPDPVVGTRSGRVADIIANNTAAAAPTSASLSPKVRCAPPPPSMDPFAPDWVAPQRPGAAAAAARAPRAAAALRRARAEWSGMQPAQALAPPASRIGAAAAGRGGGVGIAINGGSGKNADSHGNSGNSHGSINGVRLSGGFGSMSPRLLRPAQRVRTIQQRQAHQQYLMSLPADRGTPFLPPTWHQLEDPNNQGTGADASAADAAGNTVTSATHGVGASAFTTTRLSETNDNSNNINNSTGPLQQQQQQQMMMMMRAAGARVKAVLHRRGNGNNGANEFIAVAFESRPNTPSSSSSQQQQYMEGSADAVRGFPSVVPDRGLLLGALHGSPSHRFEPGDTWHNASTPLALKKGIPSAMACRRILAHMNRHRPVASSFENTVFVLRDELTGAEVEVDKQSSEPFFWPS